MVVRFLRRIVSTLVLLMLLLPPVALARPIPSFPQLLESIYAWFTTTGEPVGQAKARLPASHRGLGLHLDAVSCAPAGSGSGSQCPQLKVTCDAGGGTDPNGCPR